MRVFKVDSNTKITEFVFPCSCGCGVIRFERFTKYSEKDPEDTLNITHYVSSFEANQFGLWKEIKKRCKMAFLAITGKEYLLYDILLIATKDIDAFKELVKGL